MAYSEENGQVVLRMNRGDYKCLLMVMGMATGAAIEGRGLLDLTAILGLMNRLNEGNRNYTPYEVAEK